MIGLPKQTSIVGRAVELRRMIRISAGFIPAGTKLKVDSESDDGLSLSNGDGIVVLRSVDRSDVVLSHTKKAGEKNSQS